MIISAQGNPTPNILFQHAIGNGFKLAYLVPGSLVSPGFNEVGLFSGYQVTQSQPQCDISQLMHDKNLIQLC